MNVTNIRFCKDIKYTKKRAITFLNNVKRGRIVDLNYLTVADFILSEIYKDKSSSQINVYEKMITLRKIKKDAHLR